MYKLLVIAALIGVAISSPNKIDRTLVNSLETNSGANIMIDFVGGNTQAVNSIETRSFPSRTERLTTLKTSLKSQATKSQQNVVSFLKSKNVKHKSFWISNQIYIRNADTHLVKAIAAFPEVELVSEEPIIVLDTPIGKSPPRNANFKSSQQAEWNIEKIQAPEAWAITNGTGVVVASIDTGVRSTHEAVRDNFRGEYGWYDPYDTTSPVPNDGDGHGTHTMGIIVGGNGFGVAPGATWMTCRGCTPQTCDGNALVACAEWVVCPTLSDGSESDCSKAPVVVSNSWGGGRGDYWFEPIAEAWIAGGIVPVFSTGNRGPNCGTATSPGDVRIVIAVGSTNFRDQISYFSSLGPTVEGRIKPDISAPGENVQSSVPDSDTSYGWMSGTSMACPHVAGVTALLLSVNPDLTFSQVRSALLAGVDTNLSSSGNECSGVSDSTFPNHHYGYGRINALKVVQAAKAALKN